MDHDGRRRVGKHEEKGFRDSCTAQTALLCCLFLSFSLCWVDSLFFSLFSQYCLRLNVEEKAQTEESLCGEWTWRQNMLLDQGYVPPLICSAPLAPGLEHLLPEEPWLLLCGLASQHLRLFLLLLGWGAGGAKSPSHLTSPDQMDYSSQTTSRFR